MHFSDRREKQEINDRRWQAAGNVTVVRHGNGGVLDASERAKEPRRYPFADGLPIEGEASEVSRIVPRSERKIVLSASDAPQIAA